jgi:hypothetical protein
MQPVVEDDNGNGKLRIPAGDGHDWMGAEAFVRAGADPSQFRLLIEDQDGNVRSFSYSDMDRYANMTKEEIKNRQDLPPITNGCGS